ncbi:MAG: tetratricopeptide repeat protein [Methanosarcinales archaeon]|nr:tetratricopeptide repeat protein [Methanosarcinales archaeon]
MGRSQNLQLLFHYYQGKYDEATQCFDEILRLDPELAQA